MAPRRTKRPGQGFSLFDLQDDISSTVDSLGDALSRQGVAVDRDALLLAIQNVVTSIGNSGSSAMPYSYPSMASDLKEIPYSVAGDKLCMAHEYYQLGNKREAVKQMLEAMEEKEFAHIAQGLLEMNRLAEKTNSIFAADADKDDTENEEDDDNENDDTTDNTDEDDDTTSSDDDDSDDDLSDQDIDDLIEDSDDDTNKETTADDNTETDNATQDEEEEDEEDKDKDKQNKDSDVPMGGTSSTMEASMTSKVLANKLSLQGDQKSRSKAIDFMKTHSRL